MTKVSRPVTPATFAAVRCELSIMRNALSSCRDWLRRGLLSPFDQKPEHDRQLTEQHWLRKLKCSSVIIWSEQRDRAQNYVAEAIDHQPNADPPRQKSGAKNEQPKRKQPQAPKDFGHKDAVAVETEE